MSGGEEVKKRVPVKPRRAWAPIDSEGRIILSLIYESRAAMNRDQAKRLKGVRVHVVPVGRVR